MADVRQLRQRFQPGASDPAPHIVKICPQCGNEDNGRYDVCPSCWEAAIKDLPLDEIIQMPGPVFRAMSDFGMALRGAALAIGGLGEAMAGIGSAMAGIFRPPDDELP